MGARYEIVGGIDEKPYHADTIWTFSDYADLVVPGGELVIVCKGRTWRLDFYSRIFLWFGKFCYGSMETVRIGNETGENGRQAKTGVL